MCPGWVWCPCGNTAGLSPLRNSGAAISVPEQEPQHPSSLDVSMRPHTPVNSYRSPYLEDFCWYPQSSPNAYKMVISVLGFFIFTGEWVQRTVFSGGVALRSRKLRAGPEKGPSGKHSLLELYHGDRDGQPSEHGSPQPPCSSHTESYFLLTSLSWPPLLASWHISSGGLQGQPCPAVWGRPESFLLVKSPVYYHLQV